MFRSPGVGRRFQRANVLSCIQASGTEPLWNILPKYQSFRHIAGQRAIRYALVREGEPETFPRMICPQCRSADCFRSHRSGAVDFVATAIGLRPWRCDTCDYRFFGRRVAVAFSGYAHCPRCGNFAVDRIAGERVDDGTLVFLKRFLRFPAYRCAPCRERFFSTLPYRKIIPSMPSSMERQTRIAS